MFRPVWFLGAFLLLSLAPFAHAGGKKQLPTEGISYRRESGPFSSSEDIYVPNSQNLPNVMLLSKDTQFITGDGARQGLPNGGARRGPALDPAHPAPENVGAPPSETQLLPLNQDGQVRAGLSELFPGSDVWVVSRHALLGMPAETVRTALKSAAKDPAKYVPFEFSDLGGTVDAVILVPSNRITDFFEIQVPNANCASCSQAPIFKLKPLPQYTTQIGAESQFYARQFGKRGSQTVTQTSRGSITAMNDEAFFLDPGAANSTTVKSSGSVVQVSPVGQQNYGVGGVVECVVAPSTQRGVAVPGGARVVPMRRILQSDGQMTTLEKISSEAPKPRGLNGDCSPVDDGRGGG